MHDRAEAEQGRRAAIGYPSTGRRFESVDEIGICRLRDGRIVESWGIEDNLSRLQQPGLLDMNEP